MLTCEECGQEVKTSAGLASHRRARHRGGRTVAERVAADLEGMSEAVRSSALAGTALLLAERLDAAGVRDAAPLARTLQGVLGELRELASVKEEGGRVDELKARRLKTA